MDALRVERLHVQLPLILAFLVVLWSAPPEVYPLGAQACLVLLAGLALACLAAGTTSHPGQTRFLLLLLLPLALSFPQAMDRGAAVERLVLLAAALLLFAAARGLAPQQARGVLLLLAAGGAVLALHGLWQHFFALPQWLEAAAPGSPEASRLATGRIFSRFLLPSIFASFLLLAGPVAVGLACAASGWRRVPAWLAVAVIAVALLLTRSHGALAALLVMIILWSIAVSRRHRRWLVIVLLAGLAGFAAVSWSRDGVVAAEDEGPVALRLRNARATVIMMIDRPALGHGGGAYGMVYPAYRQPGDNETRFAHNSYLQVLAEHGLTMALPLVVMLTAWGCAIRRLNSAGHGPLAGAAFGLGAFLIHNLADFSALLPSTLWTAATLAGVVVAAANRSQQATPAATGTEPLRQQMALVPRLALVTLFLLVFTAGGRDAGARALLEEGRVQIAESAPAAGLQSARRATALAPWQASPHLLQAEVLLHHPELSEGASGWQAWQEASRAVELAPAWPAAHGVRAAAAAKLGQPGLAAADLQRAADLYPMSSGYGSRMDALADRLLKLREVPR